MQLCSYRFHDIFNINYLSQSLLQLFTTSHVLLRNIIAEALSSRSPFLALVIVSPAVENKRSEGLDVAGMHRNFLAKAATWGNVGSWTFHHAISYSQK